MQQPIAYPETPVDNSTSNPLNGPTHSTGTNLFLNDLLIARRDPDGQIFAVKKGMNGEAEAMLRDGNK